MSVRPTKPQPWTRVSTLIAGLDDPYSLNAWRLRQCVKGLGARSDLFARGAAAAAADNRHELDQVVEQAIEAARSSEGANVGTAVHSFTQQVDEDRLEPAGIPDPWRAPVEAYRRAMNNAGLTVDPEWIEATVRIDALDAAGTADRIVTTGDGRRLVLDVKTGRIDYLFSPKLAAQLAAYSRASHRWMGPINFDRFGRYQLGGAADPQWQPVEGIDPDVGVVCHIDPATADVTIRYVDLDEGWEWAQLGRHLYEVRKLKLDVATDLPAAERPASVGQPTLVSGDTKVVDDLRDRVRTALTVDGFERALRAHWPRGVPTLAAANGHDHSDDELERIALAITRAEADAGVAF